MDGRGFTASQTASGLEDAYLAILPMSRLWYGESRVKGGLETVVSFSRRGSILILFALLKFKNWV